MTNYKYWRMKPTLAMLTHEHRPNDRYDQLTSPELMSGFKSDMWSRGMLAFFDTCEELFRRDVEIPIEWAFTPGAAAFEPPSDLEALMLTEVDTDILLRYGHYLKRFTDQLDADGYSY